VTIANQKAAILMPFGKNNLPKIHRLVFVADF